MIYVSGNFDSTNELIMKYAVKLKNVVFCYYALQNYFPVHGLRLFFLYFCCSTPFCRLPFTWALHKWCADYLRHKYNSSNFVLMHSNPKAQAIPFWVTEMEVARVDLSRCPRKTSQLQAAKQIIGQRIQWRTMVCQDGQDASADLEGWRWQLAAPTECRLRSDKITSWSG